MNQRHSMGQFGADPSKNTLGKLRSVQLISQLRVKWGFLRITATTFIFSGYDTHISRDYKFEKPSFFTGFGVQG